MFHRTPSRRSVLAVLAGTTLTSGCLGRLTSPARVRLTGVRVHNWVEAETTVTFELRREGTPVLEKTHSLAPLREPGSVVSFPAQWSVEPANYRVQVTVDDGEARLDRSLPPREFAWDGCAFLDVDVESRRRPDGTPDDNPTRSIEAHLQEVNDADDFSADSCQQ